MGAEPDTKQGKWEAHTGLDYTVVMLPGETTDDASIRVFGENAPALAQQIAAFPDLLTTLQEVVAIADRETEPFIRARAVIAKATGSAT